MLHCPSCEHVDPRAPDVVSVGATVGASVGATVGASVGAAVGAAVGAVVKFVMLPEEATAKIRKAASQHLER